MNKKHIIKTIAVIHLIFIFLVFYMVQILKYQLTIKDILIKYSGVLLIGLFLELYPRLMNRVFKINTLLKIKKIDFFLFIKIIFIVGILTFGVGLGTIILLLYVLVLDNKITNATQIIYFYLPYLAGGVIFSMLMIASVMIYNRIKKRKEV